MKKLFSEIPCLKEDHITLRALTADDADGLRELTESEEVYRYLPTFLFEKQYEDKKYVIRHLYDECIRSSLILGVFWDDEFCGLAEIYGYRPSTQKASVGYRLIKRYWGRGIAAKTLSMMVKYLLEETDVRIITASTMPENTASANVLRKNGFRNMTFTALENWGLSAPLITEKWIRVREDLDPKYQFKVERIP